MNDTLEAEIRRLLAGGAAKDCLDEIEHELARDAYELGRRDALKPTPFPAATRPWRVGRKVGRTIYAENIAEQDTKSAPTSDRDVDGPEPMA